MQLKIAVRLSQPIVYPLFKKIQEYKTLASNEQKCIQYCNPRLKRYISLISYYVIVLKFIYIRT